jgi:hypothetical protein
MRHGVSDESNLGTKAEFGFSDLLQEKISILYSLRVWLANAVEVIYCDIFFHDRVIID